MNKKHILSFFMIMMTKFVIAPPASQGIDPMDPVTYPPHYHPVNNNTPQFDPQAPGFNIPDDDPIFHSVQPIPFKPEYQTTGTINSNDKNTIGYFWNTKDNDPSIIYPGKARINNDQFINVVIVDSKNVDHTGQADDFAYTNVENIYNLNSPQTKKFQPDFLVRIGSLVRKGKTYDLYGQYESTIIPDSESVQSPLFVDVKN